MTIVSDDYRVVNKLEASLTDDALVVIYDHQMFIVQATSEGVSLYLCLCLYLSLRGGFQPSFVGLRGNYSTSVPPGPIKGHRFKTFVAVIY